MPWPKTAATHYHEQLGLPDKVCKIKGLISAIVGILVPCYLLESFGLWSGDGRGGGRVIIKMKY